MQVFERLTTPPCLQRENHGGYLGTTLPAHPFELALFPSTGNAVPKGWIRSLPSTSVSAERRRPTLQNMHRRRIRRSLPKKRSLLHVEKRSLLHAETASKRGARSGGIAPQHASHADGSARRVQMTARGCQYGQTRASAHVDGPASAGGACRLWRLPVMREEPRPRSNPATASRS